MQKSPVCQNLLNLCSEKQNISESQYIVVEKPF